MNELNYAPPPKRHLRQLARRPLCFCSGMLILPAIVIITHTDYFDINPPAARLLALPGGTHYEGGYLGPLTLLLIPLIGGILGLATPRMVRVFLSRLGPLIFLTAATASGIYAALLAYQLSRTNSFPSAYALAKWQADIAYWTSYALYFLLFAILLFLLSSARRRVRAP